MRLKNTTINGALLIGSILIFFLAIELVIRLTGIVSLASQPPQIYVRHENPWIGYSLKPNVKEKAYRTTVTTNSLGMRGPEIDRSKPLMAVVGDSITFGYGVEDDETLPAKLQDLFPDWGVLNYGVPGYTLRQENELLKEHAGEDRLYPNVLVHVFYFNDLDDQRPPVLDGAGVLREPGFVDTGAPACNPITKGALRFVPGQCWLNRHSAFFIGVRKFLSAKQEHENLAAQETEYRSNMFRDDVSQEKLDAYEAVLKEYNASLKDLPRLFVIWPEKHVHYLARPKLKAMAEANGFRVLDLYEIFGNTPESLSWDTVHPAPKTIAEAADVIAAALEYFDLVSQ